MNNVKPSLGLARIAAFIGSGIAVLIVLWVLFSAKPMAVELAAVTEGEMQVTIDNRAQTRVKDKYVLAAPVAAELQRIAVREGDSVRKNQALAQLRVLPLDMRQRDEATAKLDAARALAREAGFRATRGETDLRLATNERVRVEKLVAQGFVSTQAAEKAIAGEAAARTEWQAAQRREMAAWAEVRAVEAVLQKRPAGALIGLVSPIDGQVLRVHEKSARAVAAGMPLLSLGDPANLEVVADVLSSEALKIKPGAIALLNAGEAKALRAKVRMVEPEAFTKISALGIEEQRVNVILDLLDTSSALGDGYRVEARIVIWVADKTIIAPASSLFRAGDQWHVFVAEAGRARERLVKVGQRNSTQVQILEGLKPGERVVRFPGNQLHDGARISAVD